MNVCNGQWKVVVIPLLFDRGKVYRRDSLAGRCVTNLLLEHSSSTPSEPIWLPSCRCRPIRPDVRHLAALQIGIRTIVLHFIYINIFEILDGVVPLPASRRGLTEACSTSKSNRRNPFIATQL